MEGFHHRGHSDIRAAVDELMVRFGRVGPRPRVGEGVELCLARLSARFAEENVVIRVGIKWRIEIHEVDTRVRELFRVPQPAQVVAEIESVHAGGRVRDISTSLNMTICLKEMFEGRRGTVHAWLAPQWFLNLRCGTEGR